MKKREAFELARRFREDHPELTDRPLRICHSAATGHNAYTVIKMVPHGPRGEMELTRCINSSTGGTMITRVGSGDTIMVVDYSNGWPTYNSYPALPHDECSTYADQRWQPEFTTEEKIASIEWAIENFPPDPHTHWQLDESLRCFEYQQEEEEKLI